MFKKLTATLLSGIVLVSCMPLSAVYAESETAVWDGSADVFWYDDNETVFHISTAEELAGLAKLVNGGNDFADKTVYLDNSIYLNDVTDVDNWFETSPENVWTPPENVWTPIGYNSNNRFSGNFDGQNNEICGIYAGNSYSGLFGIVHGGTVKNITVKKSLIFGDNVGGIAGYADDATFANVCNYADIRHLVDKEGIYLGGIVGQVSSSCNIIYAQNYGNIEHYGSFSTPYAGGIIGYSYSYSYSYNHNNKIENCVNYGDVVCKSDSSTVAGIAHLTGGTIKNCYNFGNLYSDALAYGIGHANNLESCYNVGNITSSNYRSYGIGYARNISNCYYLNTSCDKGSTDSVDTIANPNQAAMQKASFVKTLGDAFVYVEGDYPKLAWQVDGFAMGDINYDWAVNVADAVLLSKYLLGDYQYTEDEWKRSDIDRDGVVDCFDMIEMRKKIS